MTTKKQTHEFEAGFEAEIGDYNSQKFKGHVNIPMGDTVAARFAAISTQRDGYTTNLFTGGDIAAFVEDCLQAAGGD